MSSFVLPCWGRETGERPTIYLRGGASVTSLVTPASRFAPFTSVCLPPKSGVVWTVGWLAVFRLRWGDRRVGPDEASGKEMDPEPFERDGTTRNTARTCRLPLFVISPNLGSLGLSVVSVHPLFRDWSDASSRTDLPGKRRTWDPSNATKPNETKHERVVYPRL